MTDQKLVQSATIDDLNALNAEERKSFNIQLKQEALHSVPRNAEELWHCVKVLFDKEIPYTSTHPDFNAPFEWFSKLFFRKVPYSLAIASRGGSKTFNAAMLNYLNGYFYPNLKSVHSAATKVQAEVMASYLNDFDQDEVLGLGFKKNKVNKFSVEFQNTSTWRIVAGNMKSISGQHPVILTLDEIEFWPIDGLIQSLRVPLDGSGGQRKIWAGFSTRQRSFGGMNKMVDEAEERNIQVFKWSAFETMQRCKTCIAIDQEPNGNDESRQKVCNLWEDCHGERGTKATGWVSLSDVQEFKQSLKGNTAEWRTQGLCDRPSSHGLVLHNFEHGPKPEGNYSDWEYRPELPYYIAHDPAESKKSCMFFIQIYEDRIYIFDEIIQDQCSDTTQDKEALYAYIVGKQMAPPTLIIVDPRRPEVESIWKKGSEIGEGLNYKFNALCPPIDDDNGGAKIYMGIEYLRSQICAGDGKRYLFVNPGKCKGLVHAIKEYHYKMGTNNEILGDQNPDKAWSDEIDAVRYFVQYYQFVIRKGKTNFRVRWLNG